MNYGTNRVALFPQKKAGLPGQLSKLRTYYLTRNRLLMHGGIWRSNRWLSFTTTLAAGKTDCLFY